MVASRRLHSCWVPDGKAALPRPRLLASPRTPRRRHAGVDHRAGDLSPPRRRPKGAVARRALVPAHVAGLGVSVPHVSPLPAADAAPHSKPPGRPAQSLSCAVGGGACPLALLQGDAPAA